MKETQVWSLGWEDPLEKEMATHSSILAWEILWGEKTGGLQSMGSQKSQTGLRDWTTTRDYIQFMHVSLCEALFPRCTGACKPRSAHDRPRWQWPAEWAIYLSRGPTSQHLFLPTDVHARYFHVRERRILFLSFSVHIRLASNFTYWQFIFCPVCAFLVLESHRTQCCVCIPDLNG